MNKWTRRCASSRSTNRSRQGARNSWKAVLIFPMPSSRFLLHSLFFAFSFLAIPTDGFLLLCFFTYISRCVYPHTKFINIHCRSLQATPSFTPHFAMAQRRSPPLSFSRSLFLLLSASTVYATSTDDWKQRRILKRSNTVTDPTALSGNTFDYVIVGGGTGPFQSFVCLFDRGMCG